MFVGTNTLSLFCCNIRVKVRVQVKQQEPKGVHKNKHNPDDYKR